MNRINCLDHFIHPFSEEAINLTSKQKKITLGVATLLTPFLIIPGLLAFFGVSYYFKNRNIHQLNSKNLSKTSNKTKSLSASLLNNFLKSSDKQKYINSLHSSQPKDFAALFVEVLIRGEKDFIPAFFKPMSREELNGILKKHSNFKLRFGHKEILSHKALLEIFFPFYFKKVFASGTREMIQGEIDLPKDEFHCVQSVLDLFIFNKKLVVNEDNLAKFTAFSEKYQVLPMKEQCEQFVLSNLNDIDLDDIMELADLYNLEAVKSALIQKIIQNKLPAKEITNPTWKDWLPHVKELSLETPFNKEILKKCTRLEKLRVKDKHRNLSDNFPELSINDEDLVHWQGMPLRHLDVSNCKITDKGLALLQGMPLQHLNLSGCKITDQGLPHLLKLPLQDLNLSRCWEISDNSLALLQKMPLRSLNLSGCKITDQGLPHLQDMPLQDLNLSSCKHITDQGLPHLQGMPLQKLHLGWCKITNKGLALLQGMPLRKLNLYSCKITDQGLSHLQGMPLQKLNLNWCKITDQGLPHLQGMPLQKLNLSGCEHITDQGLPHLQGVRLQKLNLSGCKITDQGLPHLQGMPLQKLDLSHCYLITDQGLPHLRGMFLQKLNLSGCNRITDKSLSHLRGMPLQKLSLGSGIFVVWCNFTAKGLFHLQKLPLQHLSLRSCKITIEGVASLKKMPLQKLYLGSCKITSKGVASLKEMPLQKLNLVRCKITDKGLTHLQGLNLSLCKITERLSSFARSCLCKI